MTKNEALKLALEFVENSEGGTADLEAHIKEALAQPERDYERGFIDGMQKQMQSSVDKAVNAMSRTWVGLTGQEKELIASVSLDVHDAVHRTDAKLKEKNT